MKRVIIVFSVITAIQLPLFYFGWNVSFKEFPLSLIRYALLPGYFFFAFLPFSPEYMINYPGIAILPILGNSWIYTILFATGWLVLAKIKEGRAS